MWWLWEVVTKGSGDFGKWWRRECGDFGKWWRREVVTKGVWWLWEVVTLGSGDEGKWWRWEVVTKGSGDFGKWWRTECGDFGKWWLWEVVTKEVVTKGSGDEGSGDEGNAAKCIVMAAWTLHGACVGEEAGARNLVFFRIKWLQLAMKGPSCVRRVWLGSFQPRMCSSFVFCNEWLFLCGYLVLCMFWICGCRSEWNGCMIVVIWCCHVRREMRVSHVMLQHAL